MRITVAAYGRRHLHNTADVDNRRVLALISDWEANGDARPLTVIAVRLPRRFSRLYRQSGGRRLGLVVFHSI